MPRKPKPKPDDPEQYKRFLETAKKVEADEDPKVFERAFKRIARTRGKPKPAISAASSRGRAG